MPSLIAKLKATPQIKSCLIELSNTSAEAFVGLEGAHSQVHSTAWEFYGAPCLTKITLDN